MKIIYLVGIILLLVFIYSLYDLYDLGCYFTNTCDIEKDNVEKKVDTSTVRCPPEEVKDNRVMLNTAQLYKDNQYVQNKGFTNELIYKPPTYSDELINDSTPIMQPTIPLNEVRCKLSSDLPIANININYLLHQNSTKLRPS